MGRGGARPGAGRKPKPKAAVVLGMDGQRRESAPPSGLFTGEPETQLNQVAELLHVPFAG